MRGSCRGGRGWDVLWVFLFIVGYFYSWVFEEDLVIEGGIIFVFRILRKKLGIFFVFKKFRLIRGLRFDLEISFGVVFRIRKIIFGDLLRLLVRFGRGEEFGGVEGGISSFDFVRRSRFRYIRESKVYSMILLFVEEEEVILGVRFDKVRIGDWVRVLLELRVVGFFFI